LAFWSKRSQTIAFFSCWLAILMAPALLVTLSYNLENVHDRYLYLPSVTVCVLVATMLKLIHDRRQTKLAAVILIAIAAGSAAVTIHESSYWKNDLLLAQHALSITPGNALAELMMGNAYIRQGEIKEAIPYLVDSLDGIPDNADTLRSLGLCYMEIDALPLAEQYLTRAISLNRSRPEGFLLMGALRLKQNRFNEAEASVRQGLAAGGGRTSMYHYTLGNILYAKGDKKGALMEFRTELQNNLTMDPNVRSRIAEIEAQQGDP
jgi:tetratricopeptide (TPR) repeat protein